MEGKKTRLERDMLAKSKKKKRHYELLYGTLCQVLGKNVDYEDITPESCEHFKNGLFFNNRRNKMLLDLLKEFIDDYQHEPPEDNQHEPPEDYTRVFDTKMYPNKRKKKCLYLNREELVKVLEYDTSTFSKQNIAAWWIFCVMSLTGAEYKDAIDFSTDNINYTKREFYYIKKRNNKDIVIPLFSKLECLLSKKPLLSSVRNGEEYKHLVCNVFSQMGFEYSSLYSPVSARITFATILWNAGCSIKNISKLMGCSISGLLIFIAGYSNRRRWNFNDIF